MPTGWKQAKAAPEGWHEWRNNARELAIVVTGVLIALLAQEVVQSWQWSQKVAAAERAMQHEMLWDNGPQLTSGRGDASERGPAARPVGGRGTAERDHLMWLVSGWTMTELRELGSLDPERAREMMDDARDRYGDCVKPLPADSRLARDEISGAGDSHRNVVKPNQKIGVFALRKWPFGSN